MNESTLKAIFENATGHQVTSISKIKTSGNRTTADIRYNGRVMRAASFVNGQFCY